MVRYSFIVWDFHPLSLAGFNRRTKTLHCRLLPLTVRAEGCDTICHLLVRSLSKHKDGRS